MAIITKIQRFGVALFFALVLAAGWTDSALATSAEDSWDVLPDGELATTELIKPGLITQLVDGDSLFPDPFPQLSLQPSQGWPSKVAAVQQSTVTLVKQDPEGHRTVVHQIQQQVTSWTPEKGEQTQTLLRKWTETTQAAPDEPDAQPRLKADDSAEIQCAALPVAYDIRPEANRRPVVLQHCFDSGDTDDFLGQQMEEEHKASLNT